MNDAKQRLLLEYLISSSDIYTLTKSLIKPSYFDPALRSTIKWVNDYYEAYNGLPSPIQIKAETDVDLELHVVTRDQQKYCTTEIEAFCRRKALEQAIMNAPQLIKDGKSGEIEQLIRDALLVKISTSLGLDYFDNPLDRLEDMLAQAPRHKTGFGQAFDDLIGGGLARTEMILFTANSGGGKSLALANLALNFSLSGKNVVYISLELSEQMIAQRFDQMLSGVSQVLWRENYESIADNIRAGSKGSGKLTVKRMGVGTNSNEIRAFIKEYELKYGFVPDLLVVDYLDLMGTNSKMTSDNISEKDKQTTEQLRDIGFDYDMYIASASQQNRSGIDAALPSQAHIAGGLTKINTVDISVSILFSAVMKASGQIGFAFTKTRSSDGVGKTALCEWATKYLRILPMVNKPEDAVTERYAPTPAKDSKKIDLSSLISKHSQPRKGT